MYKKRIRKWKINKNNKRAEMLFAARTILKRRGQGKASHVKIRRREIPEREIVRYLKRANLLEVEDKDIPVETEISGSVAVSTPSPKPVRSDTVISTPTPSLMTRPRIHRVETSTASACEQESTARKTHETSAWPNKSEHKGLSRGLSAMQLDPGFDVCCDNILSCLDPAQEFLVCVQNCLPKVTAWDSMKAAQVIELGNLVIALNDQRKLGNMKKFWSYSNALFATVHDLLRNPAPCLAGVLLDMLAQLRRRPIDPDLVAMLCKHLYDLAETLHGHLHPFTALISRLARGFAKDLLYEAFLDIAEAAPMTSEAGITIRVVALLNRSHMAKDPADMSADCERLRSMRPFAMMNRITGTLYYDGITRLCIRSKQHSDAETALHEWKTEIEKEWEDNLRRKEHIYALLRQAELSCCRCLQEDCLVLLETAWIEACEIQDNGLMDEVASDFMEFGFGNPYSRLET